jgi:glutathione S-transferase
MHSGPFTLHLVGLHVSPWSIRSRWTMHHAGLTHYTFEEYTPIVGEYYLRYRCGNYWDKITVPILFATDLSNNIKHIVTDSVDIAKFADTIRISGPSLFPKGSEEEINRFVDLANKMMECGRHMTMSKINNHQEAKDELVPGWMKSIPWIGNKVGNSAVSYMLNKYPTNSEQDLATYRSTLQLAKEQLQKSEGEYLVNDTFTFADIALASAMNPPAKFWNLPFGFRKMLDETALQVSEYRDLLAWRDNIYEKHFNLPLDTQ